MTIKLFYFISDTYPAWRFDVVELFGQELPKKGISVTWCMRRNDTGRCTTVEQDGQRIHLPASLGKRSTAAKVVNRFLEAFCEIYWFVRLIVGPRFDIIQVRDDRYLAGGWAWLAARLTGAKFVYWVSFPFPENDIEKSLRTTGLKRLFLAARARLTGWWLYSAMLTLADHVFVQSEEMQRAVAAYGIPWDRMSPVPMGIPIRLLETEVMQNAVIEPGLIAYVGTLGAVRRLDVIIEAFAIVHRNCPYARLMMIGDGDVPAERLALEEQVQHLGLTDYVTFTGFLPVAEVWRLLANVAIGLSPIFVDRVLKVGSPTKLVEYMAMGKPAVCNNHPEQSMINGESHAGLCVPWGVDQFAEAIIWMLQHPDKASEMGKRGPAWVMANRTYPIIAAHVHAKYQQILDSSA